MLTRWNDFRPLARFSTRSTAGYDPFDALRREMNRLFFDFERELPGLEQDTAPSTFPRASLEDGGSQLLVRLEVPGVEQKDIELSLEGSTLTLKGERKEQPLEGYSVHRKERSAFRFARSFTLPAKVDAEGVTAELKQGVLTVTLPKVKEAQPRQINIRAGA
jgi:HSP20 family protein